MTWSCELSRSDLGHQRLPLIERFQTQALDSMHDAASDAILNEAVLGTLIIPNDYCTFAPADANLTFGIVCLLEEES
jgi:hypothetical protein